MLTAGVDEVDEDQSSQLCSVLVLEAGTVDILVIFTGLDVLLVELDQSSHVCSKFVVVESAGALLVLVTLIGANVVEVLMVLKEVVLSAGMELDDQSSQVCSSLELELVELAMLTGEEVVAVLVIFTGVELGLAVLEVE